MDSSGLKEDIFYSSSWMQEILEISNIGLWLLEINKNNTDVRLYADDKMLELLGLQKSLSLEDNYKHFAQGVLAEDLEIVQKYIEQMLTTKRLVEVQYRWKHPWWGTIFIRCSGKLYKEDDNAYYIRGYHQNASDVEVLRQANIEKSRQLIEVVRKRDYYDELFQSVLCGIVQYRPQADGSIVFQNANMEAIRIFGYEKEEFWKRKSWRIEDLAAPEDCDRVYQSMNAILLGKGKQSFEYRALRADGTYCWIIGSGEYIKNIDGERVIQSVFLDIDNRKQMELLNQELLEQDKGTQELLSQVLEGTKIFHFYYYPQKRLEVMPVRTSKYFNCSMEYRNIPESFVEDFVSGESKADCYAMYEAIHNGAKTASSTFCDKNKQCWVRVTMTVMSWDDQQQPTFVIGIIEDISEQKGMELEKIELQSIYNFTIEHDYDAVCICDLNSGDYVMRFAGYCAHYGLPLRGSINEQLPVFIKEFVCEEDCEHLKSWSIDSLLKCLEQEEAVMLYFRSSAKDGYRYKEVKLSYFGKLKERLLLTMRDIHERTMQEEANKQIISDAYQLALQANQAKSEFFSKMSHDIRTPMNAIMGLAALAAHCDDKDHVDDYLKKIVTSGKHMLELLNEVLDMSKIESGKTELNSEAFLLKEKVEEALDIIKPAVEEKRHQLIVETEALKNITVLGDALRLQQILLNLLSNAVKYTPDEGVVKLTVTVKPLPHDLAVFDFIVEDNGIGMEQSFIERIFEPFIRAEDSRVSKIQGTGLGMTISLNLAKLMNGSIDVESCVGKGSKITASVCLKVQRQNGVAVEYEQPAGDNENAADIDYSGKRVLVVEDNAINLEIALEFLKLLGLTCESAGDGAEALEKFLAAPEGYYDLIFMDIQMPTMNGYEAARAIRAASRSDAVRIPIIAITANAFSEDVKMALAAGMNAHIAKPFELRLLKKIIRQWLK